jgi:hypothetical protein
MALYDGDIEQSMKEALRENADIKKVYEAIKK